MFNFNTFDLVRVLIPSKDYPEVVRKVMEKTERTKRPCGALTLRLNSTQIEDMAEEIIKLQEKIAEIISAGKD